ncbi:hypothetical protein HPB50_007791 [Hyalomma asiaticum]|uniref:Uncharacterized protein n=1 Tax=Hyalomma asiaticum TaxID=266040 RepID=A0ACB7TG38_HYAAI|nr:hypothetical protein HPB50_007791 [Hyalomma asiaticum]
MHPFLEINAAVRPNPRRDTRRKRQIDNAGHREGAREPGRIPFRRRQPREKVRASTRPKAATGCADATLTVGVVEVVGLPGVKAHGGSTARAGCCYVHVDGARGRQRGQSAFTRRPPMQTGLTDIGGRFPLSEAPSGHRLQRNKAPTARVSERAALGAPENLLSPKRGGAKI